MSNSKAKPAPKFKPRPPKTKTPHTIIEWDWLVKYCGSEEEAHKIMECIEAVYVAKTIDIQMNLPPQQRLDRIFSLYGAMDLASLSYPATKEGAGLTG